MKFDTVIYQKFEHTIVGGSVWGFDNFVFAISLDDGNPVIDKFKKLGMRAISGKLLATAEILEYLDGSRKSFSVMPKFLWGTPFQRRVWWETYIIPYGETISYEELAKRVGEPKSARAIGNALGANPIPLIIPCHRVIRTDGGLGGFTAGIEVKKKLLELEGIFI